MGLDRIEAQIGPLLVAKKMTLAVAESCTGGLLSHRITNIPGSSDYYLGGVTSYANSAKVNLLKVNQITLDTVGAVSEETVHEMAQGVRLAFNADIGISTSGIAGPGGGTVEKPVGLVWIGLSAPEGEWAWRCFFQGEREAIKSETAQAALLYLLAFLEGKLDGSN